MQDLNPDYYFHTKYDKIYSFHVKLPVSSSDVIRKQANIFSQSSTGEPFLTALM